MIRLTPLLVLLTGCPQPAPAVHFSYEGAEGPAHWGGKCADGKEQSPIDLHAGGSGFAPRLQMEYWPSQMHVINNGHTIQFEYDTGSFLIVDDKRYALVQAHFHLPSEHTHDGKGWAMEMHLVHKSEDGKLAVVALPIIAGAANQWLAPAWGDLPHPGDRRDLDAKLNAADLVPSAHVFLHYPGSLTTPPCSEGVSWFVWKTPIELSEEQIAAFAKLVPDNHRPPQSLGGRHVVEGEAH
jgi:carbonic anhydrase